jgi:hypothetical protein
MHRDELPQPLHVFYVASCGRDLSDRRIGANRRDLMLCAELHDRASGNTLVQELRKIGRDLPFLGDRPHSALYCFRCSCTVTFETMEGFLSRQASKRFFLPHLFLRSS